MGRFDEAAAELERALEYARCTPAAGLAQQFGHDPETTTLVILGSARQLVGFMDEGEKLLQTALAKGRELGHPLTLAYVLRHYGVFAMLRKNYPVVQSLAEELTNVCMKYEIRQWDKLGPLMKAWTRLQTRQDTTAIPVLQTLLEQHRGNGFRRNLPFYMMVVAEALVGSHQASKARGLIDEAYSLMQEMNEMWIEPQILRVAVLTKASAAKFS
jgi:hypothetical protein